MSKDTSERSEPANSEKDKKPTSGRGRNPVALGLDCGARGERRWRGSREEGLGPRGHLVSRRAVQRSSAAPGATTKIPVPAPRPTAARFNHMNTKRKNRALMPRSFLLFLPTLPRIAGPTLGKLFRFSRIRGCARSLFG